MSSFQELDGRFHVCIQLAYPENWKQHHTTSSNISKRNIKKDVGYMSLTAYFIPIVLRALCMIFRHVKWKTKM